MNSSIAMATIEQKSLILLMVQILTLFVHLPSFKIGYVLCLISYLDKNSQISELYVQTPYTVVCATLSCMINDISNPYVEQKN